MNEKAKSKSVSLLPSLWEKVEQRASEDFGGNRSDYIRKLVDADISGRNVGDPTSRSALEDLAEAFVPVLAPEIREWAQKRDANQPLYLAGLLEAFTAHIRNDEHIECSEDMAVINAFEFSAMISDLEPASILRLVLSALYYLESEYKLPALLAEGLQFFNNELFLEGITEKQHYETGFMVDLYKDRIRPQAQIANEALIELFERLRATKVSTEKEPSQSDEPAAKPPEVPPGVYQETMAERNISCTRKKAQ